MGFKDAIRTIFANYLTLPVRPLPRSAHRAVGPRDLDATTMGRSFVIPGRMIHSGALALAIGICAAGSAVSGTPEKEDEQAFVSALELCSDGPRSLTTSSATLENAGWSPSDEGPMMVLASNSIAFSVDATNPEYTVENGFFMAASVLSNSALGPNQLAFTRSDIRFGVMGITEGTPYCVFAGPDWLIQTALRNGVDSRIQAKTELVTLLLGENDKAMTSVALVDIDAFAEVLSRAKAEVTERDDTSFQLRKVLSPANIQVVPKWVDTNGEVQQ